MPRGGHNNARRGQADAGQAGTPEGKFTTPDPNHLVESALEKTVVACLLKDELIEKLVTKLTERLKDAVVQTLSESLKAAEDRIGILNSEIEHLKSRVDKSSKCNDDLEQYTRRNSIRVFGIKEVKGEDTDDQVIRVFKDKLGVDVSKGDIDRSHRVGEQPEPSQDGTVRWRPIIVKFVSYREKRKVYEKKKLLKGTRITIREDLTARRLEVWRAAVGRFGVRNTWTTDGRIMWTRDGKKGSATCLSDIPPK